MKRRNIYVLSLFVFGCSIEASNPIVSTDSGLTSSDAGQADGGANPVVSSSDAGSFDPVVDAGPVVEPLKLRIDVEGNDSDEGQLCTAVFGGPDGFPDDHNKAVFRACIPMRNRPVVVDNLQEGQEYAFSVYHDANSNNALDMKNIFGFKVPDEMYGFSNDARGQFGPPPWKDAKFTFDEGSSRPRIKIKR